MKTKNLSEFKYAIIGVIIVLAALVPVFFMGYAADSNVQIREGRDIMNQMMGSNYDSMDSFMNQAMGQGGTQAMYEMMGKLKEKGVTVEDLNPMAQFMNTCQSGNYTSDMMGNLDGWVRYGLGIGGVVVLIGILLWIVFWIIVILGAVLLIRWVISQFRSGGMSGKEMSILRERYAKGEITKEEFEEKKKDLMGR